jgi:hypothetical protein
MANWSEPERQIPKIKIFKSSERREVTPVFGTACPPKGLSGIIRGFAYGFSEGRVSHWLLLLFADRVDVLESALSNWVRGRSHNLLSEMGLRSELKYHGLRARRGQRRADVRRLAGELALAAGVGAGVIVLRAKRKKAA